ncbi:hypothetical protein, partial [Plesiomonas shigelloides]|uniref:hypothetical protein n=1 Tax=Plesiomonas shigelloides TaxID=703 RepID=UPI001C4671D7
WSTSKTPSYTKSVSWQHHPNYVHEKAAVLSQTAAYPFISIFISAFAFFSFALVFSLTVRTLANAR